MKLLLHVTSSQLSVAVAPPLAASQALSSASLPAPSHSTVSSAPPEMTGAVASVTVMVWRHVVVLLFSQWSVAVMVQVRSMV